MNQPIQRSQSPSTLLLFQRASNSLNSKGGASWNRMGDWLWVRGDAPLVSVGGPHTVARRTEPPPDPHRLLAMVFDNFWHTNFVADSHGLMGFSVRPSSGAIRSPIPWTSRKLWFPSRWSLSTLPPRNLLS